MIDIDPPFSITCFVEYVAVIAVFVAVADTVVFLNVVTIRLFFPSRNF